MDEAFAVADIAIAHPRAARRQRLVDVRVEVHDGELPPMRRLLSLELGDRACGAMEAEEHDRGSMRRALRFLHDRPVIEIADADALEAGDGAPRDGVVVHHREGAEHRKKGKSEGRRIRCAVRNLTIVHTNLQQHK